MTNNNLLLVDDDDIYRGGIRAALSTISRSLNIVEASTLPSALSLLDKHPDHFFQIVVSDINLATGREGLQILATSLRRYPDARRIALSGNFENAYIEAARWSGADSFIAKVFDVDVMADLFSCVLSGARLVATNGEV